MSTFHRRLHKGDSDDERDVEDEECAWRLAERWKFDEDDDPVVGPEGSDEQDHVLRDFEPRFLLLHEQDEHTLMTDNSLTITGQDGHLQWVYVCMNTVFTWQAVQGLGSGYFLSFALYFFHLV